MRIIIITGEFAPFIKFILHIPGVLPVYQNAPDQLIYRNDWLYIRVKFEHSFVETGIFATLLGIWYRKSLVHVFCLLWGDIYPNSSPQVRHRIELEWTGAFTDHANHDKWPLFRNNQNLLENSFTSHRPQIATSIEFVLITAVSPLRPFPFHSIASPSWNLKRITWILFTKFV